MSTPSATRPSPAPPHRTRGAKTMAEVEDGAHGVYGRALHARGVPKAARA
jgi:hypothetical protein